MAEYAVAPAGNLLHLPDRVPFADAAAMPVAFTTAWRMLITAARLRPGESVLVLGAGGGVGSAALTIARRTGATVYAAASTETRRRKAEELGATATVDSRGAFSAAILEQTGGRGVDIVADPHGATWPESIRSLARGGRLVVCGATAGNRPEFDIRELYQRHRRILGAPMGSWSDFQAVMGLYFRGEIGPIVDSVFPLAAAADAHRRAEAGESFGKVVLTA
jgi:NADPH2:quinone reductase